jgi:tetratricopeptide (TPR) repeat protein
MTNPRKGVDQNRANEQELEFIERVAQRLPEDTDVLRALADLYTKTGDYAEGLRIDQRLSHLCSEDPMVWYNLGCSLALMKRSEDALEALGRSLELGYDDYEWMKKDSDLSSLHGDPRFESMLEWIYNTFVQIPES